MPIPGRQDTKARGQPKIDPMDIFRGHPPGVKIYQHAYGKDDQIIEAYVFESPPRKVKLQFSFDEENEDDIVHRSFTVGFPWNYFVMTTNRQNLMDCFLWFAKQQMQTLDEPVFMAPFPNTFKEGRICLGNNVEFPKIKSFKEASKNLQRLYKGFLDSAFNYETWVGPRMLPEGWPKIRCEKVHLFLVEWEARTKAGTEIAWKPFRKYGSKNTIGTLGEAVQYGLQLAGAPLMR